MKDYIMKWIDLVKKGFSLNILVLAGFFATLVVLVYAINFFVFSGSGQDVWGQFGDYVGGLLNPILSFMALIAVVRSLKYQSDEVKSARSEANAAIAMQQEQTAIFKQQSFESVFFGLTDLHSKSLDMMEYAGDGRLYKGIPAIQKLADNFNVDRIDWHPVLLKVGNIKTRDRIPVFKEHANAFLKKVQDGGVRYFTVLEQLLSYVDGCDLPDPKLKQRYILIVKSMLTPAEVECALIYCLSDDGGKLKDLMERYSMFSVAPKRTGDAHLRNCGLVTW